MKKYVVTNESVTKLSNCFSDSEEAKDFFANLQEWVNEMYFLNQYRDRLNIEGKEVESARVLVKQMCLFIMFSREYIDMIHQMISSFDCQEVSDEEFERMKEKYG